MLKAWLAHPLTSAWILTTPHTPAAADYSRKKLLTADLSGMASSDRYSVASGQGAVLEVGGQFRRDFAP
jgi:hypothetical protein